MKGVLLSSHWLSIASTQKEYLWIFGVGFNGLSCHPSNSAAMPAMGHHPLDLFFLIHQRTPDRDAAPFTPSDASS